MNKFLKYFSLVIFFFSSLLLGETFAQTPKIDSLLSVLHRSQLADTVKVNLLSSISREHRNIGEYGRAMDYAEQGKKLAQQINYQIGLAAIALNRAGIYYFQSDFENARQQYDEALKIREALNDKQGIAQCFRGIGNVYLSQADYPQALNYYFKALKVMEELKDKKGIADNLFSIGNIYLYQNNNEDALQYYFQAKKIYEENNAQQGILDCLSNIGSIYNKDNKFDSAAQYYSEALPIAEELNNKHVIGTILGNMGVIEQGKNNLGQALDYLMKGLKIHEELGDKNNIAVTLNSIGNIYQAKADYFKAIAHYQKSLTIAEEIGALENVKSAYQNFSSVYAAMGNYKNAYEYHQLYSEIKDTLFNEESNKTMTEMSAKYESEKKEAQIKLLEKDKEVSQTEQKKQKIITFSVAGGLLLVILFAGFVFRSLRVTQKQKKELNIKNQKIENAYILIEEQKKHIEEKHKEQTDSITYAKRLQQAILPPVELLRKHLPNGFVLYKPKDIVAGDFYWMEKIDNTIFIASADCTGHGVPGAMVSVVCSNALNRTVIEFGLRDTGKILDKVTDLVLETFEKSGEQIKDGMDISFLSYNKTSKQIQWSGANNPLWYIQNGQIIEIKADKQPIGKFDIRKPFTTHTIEYSENTTFYLFTDGLPDQFGGPKGKKFMYKRFEANLSDIHKLPMDEQQIILEKAFTDWKGSLEQIDDVTVIGIKI